VLRIRGYVRYLDDLALWGDAGQLREAQPACAAFLRDELGLELKPWPYRNHTRHGLDFLGCRLFPTHMTLARASRRRFRRALVRLETAFQAGLLDDRQRQQRATALVAWTRSEGLSAWRFRQAVLVAHQRSSDGWLVSDASQKRSASTLLRSVANPSLEG
jgi:hypothetical protein